MDNKILGREGVAEVEWRLKPFDLTKSRCLE